MEEICFDRFAKELAEQSGRNSGAEEILDDYRDSDGTDAVDDVPLPQHRRKILSDSESSSDDEDDDAEGLDHESEGDDGSDHGSDKLDAEQETANEVAQSTGNAEPNLLSQIVVPSLVDEDITFDSRDVESFIYNRIVKIEAEEYYLGYGPLFQAEELGRKAEEAAKKGKKRKNKKGVPAPTYYLSGRSSTTAESLEWLQKACNISAEVELLVPSPEDRAEHPPPGYFTLYESFFTRTLMWFPIPEVMTEYLFRHGASFAQITTRGIRQLVGLLIRSYECGIELTVDHYMAYLKFISAGRSTENMYYLTNRKKRRIITGFPSKDHHWSNSFFYVQINRASVGDNGSFILTSFNPIGRSQLLAQ